MDDTMTRALAGRAALLTGGSRGLGAALGRTLARAGARVVLVARGREALDEVVAAIRRDGGEAHGLAFDVGRKEDAHAIAGAAQALVGPIDVLVHNASMLGPLPLPLLLDTECEELSSVLETNLVGPFRLTKVIAGSMALRGAGTIVCVSSDAAVAAYARWGAYGVSKAAQDHLARVLAVELGEIGAGDARVLVVDPGEMDTRMHAEAMPDADRSTLARPDEVARKMADMIARAPSLPTGTRLEAARWPEAYEALLGASSASEKRRGASDGAEGAA